MTTKMRATTPATPMTHSMAPTTILSTSTHSWAAQFWARLTLPSAIRMALIMTFASNTIPSPMKACTRVFLPVAILPGSPLDIIYK